MPYFRNQYRKGRRLLGLINRSVYGRGPGKALRRRTMAFKRRFKRVRRRRAGTRAEIKEKFSSISMTDGGRMLSTGVQSNTGLWWGFNTGPLGVPAATVSGSQGTTGDKIIGNRFFAKRLSVSLQIFISPIQLTGTLDYQHQPVDGAVYLIRDTEGDSSLNAQDAAPDEWLSLPDTGFMAFRKQYSGDHYKVVKRIRFHVPGESRTIAGWSGRKYIRFNYDIKKLRKKNPDADNWEDGYFLMVYMSGLPAGVNQTIVNYDSKLTFSG